jgi:hypothetical protein
MTSLSHESERWAVFIFQILLCIAFVDFNVAYLTIWQGFQSVLQNLVGDGLQNAAFLTYSGFFPFDTRRLLLKRWRNALDLLGIEFREDLGMIESLSKASDRLEWQRQGA